MLSVLYVIRNEQECLEKSIKSIQPIADEIVVIDTGSFDKTISICRKIPYIRIFSHAWVHDFSATKNYGIKQCKGDWILSMDGDEMLDPSSASIIKVASLNAKANIAGFAVHIADHEQSFDPNSPINDKSFFPSPQTRLFRRNPKIMFEGRVSETISPSVKTVGGIDMLNATIHHYLWHGKGQKFKDGRLNYYKKLGANLHHQEASLKEEVRAINADQTSIVIVAHNVLSATKECVEQIARHTDSHHNLYFVDNGSNDGTFEYMRGAVGRNPARFQTNVAVAKAKNAGGREVLGNPNSKYICFLDNDTKVSEKWLDRMLSILESNPKIGLIGPISNNASNAQSIYNCDDPKKPMDSRDPEFIKVNSIDGFCMLMPVSVARHIGLFDESLGAYGFEDKDFCERVKQAGYDIAIANRSFVEHRGRLTLIENHIDWQRLATASSIKFAQKWNMQTAAIQPISPPAPKSIAKKPKISIVIITHNRLDMTAPCIESLMQTTEEFELILVDNGSEDNTVDWVRKTVRSAKIIKNDRNMGVPIARNQGIRETSTDYIVIMDNDVLLKPGWLDDLMAPINNGADAVGIEGWQIDHNFSACHKCQNQHERFDYLGGACTLFKRKIFETVGLLDEGFSPAYYEDSLAGNRCIPVKNESGIDVVPLEDLFAMGTKVARDDGKEEATINAMTLSVNPLNPSLSINIDDLPIWWINFNLSEKERNEYLAFKNGTSSRYFIDVVKPIIKTRINRSMLEDAISSWQPIVKIIRHKTNKPLVRIDSKYGQTVCTTDHSLMVWDKQQLKKAIPAEAETLCSINTPISCNENNECEFPIQGVENDGIILFNNPKGENYYCPKKLAYSAIAAESIFKFLGQYTAEGSVNDQASISVYDKEFANEIAKNASVFFGRNFKVHEYDYENSNREIRGIKFTGKTKCYRIIIGNKIISKMLGDICGVGCANKKIPNFVFTAPIKLKEAFLSGLLQGEGFQYDTNSKSCLAYSEEYKKNGFKFGSKSLRLASGVCLLLGTMGKRFSVRYNEVKDEYGVDFIQYRKNSKQLINIKEIEPTNDYVYDIEVANHHTFVDAMGLLVVHNTDICIRAKNNGFNLAWNPTSKIIHREHATLIHGQKEFKYQEAIQNSHTRFAKKMRGELKVGHEILQKSEKKFSVMYLGMQYDYGFKDRGESFEHANFYPALKEWKRTSAFHHFDFVDLGKTHGIQRMSEMLWDNVKTFQPDILFAVFFDEYHDPRRETLRDISTMTRTKTIGWFCDSHFRYDSFDKPWAQTLNYNVTTSASAYQRYLQDGFALKVIKSQWGASPAYKNLNKPRDIEVSFIGQPHGDRRQIIEQIRKAGIDIQCFGTGWPQRLSFDGMIDVWNRSKINLNLNNACDVRYKQIKGRNFEVPACGGFLLTGHPENLDEYYKINQEVATFNNTEEMIEKIKYYLAHDEEREAIAKAGYERTMKDHTYSTRLDHIFSKIGLI